MSRETKSGGKKRRLDELRSKTNKLAAMPNLKPVNGEVENFHFWYTLKNCQPRERVRLPSLDTILMEKRIIDFSDHKKNNPNTVSYNRFYADMECDTLQEILHPPRLPPLSRNQIVSTRKKRASAVRRQPKQSNMYGHLSPLEPQWRLSRRY